MLDPDDHRDPARRRRNIAVRLVVNSALPVALYVLVGYAGVGAFVALAAAAGVPAVWTAAVFVWRRRVDWIGLVSVLAFAVEAAIAALLGGSTLMLEIRGAVLTGPFGLVLIVSALIDKPLLVPILRLIRPEAVTQLAAGPAMHSKTRWATAIVGAALAVHATATLVLALSLPTGAFLIASRIANWTLAGIGLALLWWARRRRASRPS
jgi:hypothetical protein